MQRLSSKPRMIVSIAACLLAALACQTPAAVSTPAGTKAASPPAATPGPNTPAATPGMGTTAAVATAAPPAATEVGFGPGPFNLPDPALGISALSSYSATLSLSFDGTRDGQPDQWSRTYVMLSSHEPPARQLTIETKGSNPGRAFRAEVNGARYDRQDDKACTASALAADRSLGAWDEPAGYLSAVIGAEAAGSDTVNGVPASHYTFDERAFGQAGLMKSTGEMWVAANGGYVVRYLLATEAGADYFGDGVKGKLTWDYQLTGANQPVKVALPADCPAGMIDAPRLPDAAGVVSHPGLLIYTTATSITETAAFYQAQLPPLGWQLPNAPIINDTTALLDFTRADQVLSVILATSTGGTQVRLGLRTVPH